MKAKTMEPYQSTTPFGRRSLTLAHVANQVVASTRPPGKVVHKWKLFHTICTARPRLGVSERALSVLNALLTFHPETTLTSEDEIIVFPSNQQLAHRSHGMPASTLRRHLAILVEAGLVVRRDSPNGKRYARKGRGGEIELAFGFDLSPLVARAEEFEALAADIEAEARSLKLVRERITLCRRDIAKMIATGIEEGVPTQQNGVGPADWLEIHRSFRAIIDAIPRTAARLQLEPIAELLTQLADDILSLLQNHIKTQNLSANESHSERHKQNSNTNPFTESEPCLPEGRAESSEPLRATSAVTEASFPLGMVLQGCPEILNYSRGGILNWRDFLATAVVVRPMLGVSPSAWEEARDVLGEVQAAVVIACILERSATINSPGGYLRDLTRRARAGEFSLGPILMAQINSRLRGAKQSA
jgi:replication initiation protein RepC